MGLDKAIQRIDSLKREWDQAQPLKSSDYERFWRKLRLEWNYNSNHIEGNTLTYGETELLLIFGQTAGNHTIREYEEMKAHDATIEHVRSLAKESRIITEADIRSLNQLILKEPYWKQAVTPDGQETRKQIIPGEYKTAPNNVRTATGEVFHFAEPLDVPVKMQKLAAWLQERFAKSDLHVTQIISKLHYDFVIIHPFDDGNGRVARLLMNYVLLHLGFPAVVIKSKDKRNYLAALNKADTGDKDAFIEYLANELIWSLELGLSAARGESIEEPDDLDKEIAVFVKQTANPAWNSYPPKSHTLLSARAKDSWLPLILSIQNKLQLLVGSFAKSEIVVTNHNIDTVTLEWDKTEYLEASLERLFSESHGSVNLFHRFKVEFRLLGFTGKCISPFDQTGGFAVALDTLVSKYEPYIYDGSGLTRHYDHSLGPEEIESITKKVVQDIFNEIKSQTAGA